MNKKIIFILVPIVLIIIIAIVITALYFSTDLFKSNEDLFWKYFAQNENIFDVMQNDETTSQNNFKQNNSYEGSGNLYFTIEQGENSLKQFNVTTNFRHDASTNREYSDVILKNGELDLLKVSYAHTGDIYAIRCDEVSPNYIGIQNIGLTELAEKYELPNSENFPDSIDVQEYSGFTELTDEQQGHIVDTYLPILMNNIGKDEYIKGNEQISIDFSEYTANIYEYNATTYSVNLSGAQLKNIILDCANTLKTDTETLLWLSNKFSMIGFGIEYTDTTNLSNKIEDWITYFSDIIIEDNLNIKLYVSDRNLVRTYIEIGDQLILTFDNVENTKLLTIDINKQYLPEQENYEAVEVDEGDEQIIDLNAVNQNTIDTDEWARIIVTKSSNDSQTLNRIKIIPDTNNLQEQIDFLMSMGGIQNDSISNSYSIEYNTVAQEKQQIINITYDYNMYKVEEIEPIEELTFSNTAVANNYEAEEFKNFINRWLSIFDDKLTEKMISLGFEDFSI